LVQHQVLATPCAVDRVVPGTRCPVTGSAAAPRGRRPARRCSSTSSASASIWFNSASDAASGTGVRCRRRNRADFSFHAAPFSWAPSLPGRHKNESKAQGGPVGSRILTVISVGADARFAREPVGDRLSARWPWRSTSICCRVGGAASLYAWRGARRAAAQGRGTMGVAGRIETAGVSAVPRRITQQFLCPIMSRRRRWRGHRPLRRGRWPRGGRGSPGAFGPAGRRRTAVVRCPPPRKWSTANLLSGPAMRVACLRHSRHTPPRGPGRPAAGRSRRFRPGYCWNAWPAATESAVEEHPHP
jgi:hypothetical protein